MKRYLFAYTLWFTAVVAAAVALFAWYKQVEQIGWQEVMQRARNGNG